MNKSFKVKNIKLNNIKLHTESFGDTSNTTCILISGAMAPARFWTDTFCKYLAAQNYFVIRYDNRDIGESSAVDWGKNPYGLSDLAKDAIGILDAYGIKKAYFTGHSMGGYICQRIALDYSNRVTGLAVISSGPIGATDETDIPPTPKEQAILDRTWEILLAPKSERSLEERIKGFLLVWRYLNGKSFFDEKMARDYTKDLLIRTHHKIQEGNNHELLMRNLSLQKYRDILKKIKISTIVIHGEKDSIVLPRYGKSISRAISKSQFVMIPGMGHMIFNKNLELKIVKLLVKFFKTSKALA
jgi:pimeloyl-ACP methyl ester carboxylesterase